MDRPEKEHLCSYFVDSEKSGGIEMEAGFYYYVCEYASGMLGHGRLGGTHGPSAGRDSGGG